MALDLTNREVNVIRDALRMAEERHKRNDFPALVLEVQDLRSKISNAMIDQYEAQSLTALRADINLLMSKIQTPIKGQIDERKRHDCLRRLQRPH